MSFKRWLKTFYSRYNLVKRYINMRVTLSIEAGQLHPNCHMNAYLIILNLKTSAIFSSALLEFLLAGWKGVVILDNLSFNAK